MAQFGSNRSIASQAFVNLTDQLGNPLVSTDSSFGSSPLGTAPLTQAFFGLPNATFNLTPPDVLSVIDGTNPMPYWDVESSSNLVMSATSTYDATTETWGVKLDPGTAVSGDTLILKTRSYLVNDDNLGLRQKAFAVIAKNGTYSGSTQWNLQMSATYYSATDTALHTAVIGTALDNATWTSLSGFTTTSGTAISASARYVDLAFTLTATDTVTSATSVTIKSALLSTKVGANTSFLVTETFTSSATWTRPTGVNYLVALVAVGGGGGADSGAIAAGSALIVDNSGAVTRSAGGAASSWFIAKDVYVGDQTTVSVGIGAGGAGGTANTFSKIATSTTQASVNRVVGANGGATTFGSYVSVAGGLAAGGTTSVPTTIIYGSTSAVGGTAGGRASALSPGTAGVAGVGGLSPYTVVPYSTLVTGATGGTASGTGGTRISGTASASTSGLIGGGGSGGWAQAGSGTALFLGANSAGAYGGGGVGASAGFYLTASGTVSGTAGSGGNGGTATGAGGGAGGAVVGASSAAANWTGSVVSLQSGKGGDGGGGFVTLVYVA